MKSYTTGTIVPPGLYVRARPFGLSGVSREPGLLEGPRGVRAFRIPGAAIPLVAALGLLLGGVYVVLFPIVGAVTLVVCGAMRAWQMLRHALALDATDRRCGGPRHGPPRPPLVRKRPGGPGPLL